MRDPLRPPQPRAAIRTPRVVRNRATIVSQRDLTHDTFEVVVRCAAGSPPLYAQAGQFAALGFPGIARPRPYSFARDPRAEQPGEHTFYIRVVPGGEVSQWLAAGDRSGAAIEIAGPLGSFGLNAASNTMICIAGGSGMSAIMALLQQACREQQARDCYFFYGARTPADLYAEEELAALARQWHQRHVFEFVQVLSDEAEDSDWRGARGLVTEYIKRAGLDSGRLDCTDAAAFLCGPPPMIDAGCALLTAAGMAADAIYRDVFEDARSPAPVIDNRRCVLCDECLLVKPVENCIVETAGLALDAGGRVKGIQALRPAHSSGLYYNTLFINERECIRCYACVSACPHGAISPEYAITDTLRQVLTQAERD